VALATAGAPATTAYSLAYITRLTCGADVNWIVYVMDAMVVISTNLRILADADPSIITVAPTANVQMQLRERTFYCNTPTGVAPFTYSIGGGFQTSPTFCSIKCSYNVTVSDANGCSTTAPALVVHRLL
jgi:hypothetical protein